MPSECSCCSATCMVAAGLIECVEAGFATDLRFEMPLV
jgi:hypothetical protein